MPRLEKCLADVGVQILRFFLDDVQSEKLHCLTFCQRTASAEYYYAGLMHLLPELGEIQTYHRSHRNQGFLDCWFYGSTGQMQFSLHLTDRRYPHDRVTCLSSPVPHGRGNDEEFVVSKEWIAVSSSHDITKPHANMTHLYVKGPRSAVDSAAHTLATS